MSEDLLEKLKLIGRDVIVADEATEPGKIEAATVAEMEREMDAAQTAVEHAVVDHAFGPGGSLPVSDLRERLKLLSDAWVEIYEDGPLRIRFDIEGRRAQIQKTQGTPGGETPQW